MSRSTRFLPTRMPFDRSRKVTFRCPSPKNSLSASTGPDIPFGLAAVIEARRTGEASCLEETISEIRGRLEMGMRDPWSHDLASLGTVAELARLLFGDPVLIGDAFDLAPRLETGYAGFRAPALCALAASAEVAGCGADEVDRILDGALDSAQNIQDPYFCVETTARVNALRSRWYPLPGPVLDVVQAFLDPEHPPPHQLHVVGEPLARRQEGPQRVALGETARRARSMADLALLFWKTESELLEANPGFGTPDLALPEGTEVEISDLDFRPWVASRLSAAVASDPDLAPSAKARWIRRLVPAAALDRHTVGAVLVRLIAVSDLDPSAAEKALGELIRGAPDGTPPSGGPPVTMIGPW